MPRKAIPKPEGGKKLFIVKPKCKSLRTPYGVLTKDDPLVLTEGDKQALDYFKKNAWVEIVQKG